MTVTAVSLETEILAALATVADPELDQPITELGFVRSVSIADDGVTVHLRLPTAFCSPNFAYLMASDAYDALRAIDGIGRGSGVARRPPRQRQDQRRGWLPTPAMSARSALRPTRASTSCAATFLRKAHTAAMERCVAALMRRKVRGPQ